MTPYKRIAKDALVNWNGLTEAEAMIIANIQPVEDLEKSVGALGSVTHAVEGIAREISLTEEEQKEFLDAVINGPVDSPIFEIVSKQAEGFTPEQELSVLEAIHDEWVIDNSNDKTFEKKVNKGQLRQYAPLELIGWNEAKSDLLFLNPILESIGVKIEEKTLSESYYEAVDDYLELMDINNKDDLEETLSSGRLYYPILPVELSSKLSEYIPVMTDQMIDNWKEKDKESYELFDSRSKDNSFNR